ncbi:MAG TPA: hypothetical protein VNS58_31555 [Puia sp.]|nr:hypothetical protein [Puia sp.]
MPSYTKISSPKDLQLLKKSDQVMFDTNNNPASLPKEMEQLSGSTRYEFKIVDDRDLSKGDRDEDVFVLQSMDESVAELIRIPKKSLLKGNWWMKG